MPQRVKRLSQGRADKVAIRSIEHGDQTWREIFDSSLRWASALRDAGVSRGDVVAIMLPQSLEPHHLWLACGWLKAVEAAIVLVPGALVIVVGPVDDLPTGV